MTEEINNLILGVRKALLEYSSGRLSPGSAEEEYSRLLGLYSGLEAGMKTDADSGFIEGLCYHHNINNFSVFSGLFKIDSEGAAVIAAFGDFAIVPKIIFALTNNIGEARGADSLKIPPGKTKGLSHSIFIRRVSPAGDEGVIFLAVSSSDFFLMETLDKTAKCIRELLFPPDRAIHGHSFYNNIINDVQSYIQQNVNDEYMITAQIFIFRTLGKMFSHMGVAALLESSQAIVDRIYSHYGSEARCFIPSMKDYIVLLKHKRNAEIPDEGRKLSFNYRNIVIPVLTLRININNPGYGPKFISDFYNFRNYVVHGDSA
jgi:hypothetical protein